MTQSHDDSGFDGGELWEAARSAQREQVQALLAPRRRTCPACGEVVAGVGATCPHCDSPMVVRRRDFQPTRRVLALLAAGLIAAGVAVAILVPGLRDAAGRERHAAAAAQARLEAAERARLRADVRPHRAAGPVRRTREDPLAYRARLVGAAERIVTADARARVKAGTISGTVAGTQCAPYPAGPARDALEADPAVPRGRYECLAYARRFALSVLEGERRTGLIGSPYWLVADYATGRMTYCKITPKAGEGGRSLASVPVPAPCRDPLRTAG